MAIRYERTGTYPNYRDILIADTEAELKAAVPPTETAEGYALDTRRNASWANGGWTVGGFGTASGTLEAILSGPVPPPGTRAVPSDVVGCSLEVAADGKWVGRVGIFASTAERDTAIGGATGNLATDGRVMARDADSLSSYRRPTGWVASVRQIAPAVEITNRQITVPLEATTDSGISVSQGPTSQANHNTEYTALTANKIVKDFVSGGNVANSGLLDRIANGIWFYYVRHSGIATHLVPWAGGGLADYGRNGGVAFFIRGIGSVSIVTQQGPPAALFALTVDGKRFSSANSRGVITTQFTPSDQCKQWVTVTTTTPKRRLVRCNVFEIYSLVYSPGITIEPVDSKGMALILGDSFAARVRASDEVGIVYRSMAASALELLGYNTIDASKGGMGFVKQGVSPVKSYSDLLDEYAASAYPVAAKINVIWLFGSGNDLGYVTSSTHYATVINKALTTFPNAIIYITTVYQGYNTDANAATLNGYLLAAIASIGSPRVVLVPVDSVNTSDGSQIWSGTGSVPAPAYDGNADVFFSSAAQGAADRHPNEQGVVHGANWLAAAFAKAMA